MNKRYIGGGGVRRVTSKAQPRIKPTALALAIKKDVDWRNVEGTGKGGIILVKDIIKARKNGN